MSPRIGSLFSGVGGLDLGVMDAIGGTVAWHVEYDEAPSKVLAHHWPDIPNYGDVTTLDWATIPPVDVLTAGYPCQPFSIAGKRKGSADDRHLWPYVLDAIRHLRPRLVVLENVRGHLSLGFGRVLGDLATAGYDTRWVCISAASVGAPHRRERIFILAENTDRTTSNQRRITAPGQKESRRTRPDSGGRGGASSTDPYSDEPQRRGGHSDVGSSQVENESASEEREWVWDTPGDSRAIVADSDNEGRASLGRVNTKQRNADRRRCANQLWGKFEPAIRRWESISGCPAPTPTVPDGRSGNNRLNAAFVEWMMGLNLGHVTDPAIGLTRNQQLKALGNGVVPQQASAAVRMLLGVPA